jgi:alpha-1,6-mannosyltransferase
VWLGLASPLLLLHAVGGVHNDVLMIGLVVAGLAAAAGGRGLLGTVLVALAVTVKAPAVLALPFVAILWAPRFRALIPTAAVAAAVVTAAGAATGLWFGWVGALGTSGPSVQWTSLPTGVGLAVGWVLETAGIGSAPSAIAVARAIGSVAAVVIAGVLWWRVRNDGHDPRRVVAACGWAFAAVVLLGPALHPWYALWALVPLAASTDDGRVRWWLAAVSAGLCFLVLPDGYNLARATVVPGVLLDVAVAVVAVVICLRWWRSREPVRMGT